MLIPKRKLISGTSGDENVDALITHTKETIINEITTSYSTFTNIAKFDYLAKIPVGTDKYPNA